MADVLYLVRHGETEWNRQQRMQGRLDSRLTAEGRAHARVHGELLAREAVERNGRVAARAYARNRAS